MADIALVSAGRVRVVQSVIQQTSPATEAIVAGAPVRFHTDGRFTNANGTAAGEAVLYGIATRSVAAGEALTAIRVGVLDGYVLDALAYSAPVYLSDTDGRIADAAGTVSNIVGRVIPGHSQPLGTAPDKLLFVDCREGVVA
jgi:hypothetical protein